MIFEWVQSKAATNLQTPIVGRNLKAVKYNVSANKDPNALQFE